jgi:hypothetical protein
MLVKAKKAADRIRYRQKAHLIKTLRARELKQIRMYRLKIHGMVKTYHHIRVQYNITVRKTHVMRARAHHYSRVLKIENAKRIRAKALEHKYNMWSIRYHAIAQKAIRVQKAAHIRKTISVHRYNVAVRNYKRDYHMTVKANRRFSMYTRQFRHCTVKRNKEKRRKR